MTKIPEPMTSIQSLIDEAHERTQEGPRAHLGCSQLGHPCERWLWLYFRWAVVEKFNGRMLRLFRRGQNEEPQVVSDLRRIGIDVISTGSHQSRVDFGYHVSGSVDGKINGGVPNAPKAKAILEIKTHSAKSFKDLVDKGVDKSKPMHFIQMQVYMKGMGVDRALYFAVNKDTDEVWTEWIHYDSELAEKAVERGKRITMSDRMPPPISTDPTWYQCKFCAAYEFCHKTNTTKEVNCRTCAHSTAKEDSTWRCERHDADGIPVDFQRQGCDSHVLHPDLVPWKMKEGLDQWTAVFEIDGRDVANGEGDAHVFTSREILANPKACSLGEDWDQMREIREAFPGAKVVG